MYKYWENETNIFSLIIDIILQRTQNTIVKKGKLNRREFVKIAKCKVNILSKVHQFFFQK